MSYVSKSGLAIGRNYRAGEGGLCIVVPAIDENIIFKHL